ncbi:hypothetical protein GCM10009530_56940 [Microbispora corallina]|uniref:Uncharacterized protein n=1 Tax=Microbispora corallina TaxID=83302 RepID=A0ABQ4G8V0_9ACTN|nr:hypothetical protein [Microbispora corallina]GIH43485.1 hypothetical protein Mco01_64850 [Microbispora corallina]
MGFFGKLLSSIDGDSGRSCPDCGKTCGPPQESFRAVTNATTTVALGWRVYFDEGGMVVDPPNRGKSGGGRTCRWCQSALSGGTIYLPYEDGSNSHAYIVCPSCKQENIQYGFGEDD